jgi:hypothetical protein
MALANSASAVVDDLRPVLEGLAKNLADRLWGPNGPPWGTKLSTLEDLVVAIRAVISEKMLREALQRQSAGSAERPAEYRICPSCGGPTGERDREPRIVQTRGGDAEWQEPHEHCTRCRRAFFPSVEEFGH